MPKFSARCHVVCICAFLLLGVSPSLAQVNVTTQHNDNNRSGDNLNETILTKANVNATTFGRLAKIPLDNQVYTQPLVVSGVSISGGTHNVVYVATTNSTVYALDADTGRKYWSRNLGPTLTNADLGLCTDINGEMGIIGTPVIDVATNTIYVVNFFNSSGAYSFQLHALNLATGADNSGSPVQIMTSGFVPAAQNQRAALTLASGNLYIPFGSHCDSGAYHGYLFSYNPATLALNGVFNTSPGGNGDSLWMSGQGPAVDASGNIYFGTSNGTWDGTQDFSESFIKLSPMLQREDWFTPANHSFLDANDEDLDTSGPLLIPGSASLFMVGKTGTGYVINSGSMGNLGDANALETITLPGPLFGSAIYFNSAQNGPEVYAWGVGDVLKAFKFNGTTLSTPAFQSGSVQVGGDPGSFLSLSAYGQKDGIIWANANLTYLRANDADNVATELYNNSSASDSCDTLAKNGYPTIANGKVYIGSFGTAASGTGELCIYGLRSTNCSTPTAPSGLGATPISSSQINLSWTASSSSCSVTYNVFRSTTSGFTPSSGNQIAQGLSGTAYSDTGLSASTTYYYLVEGTNSGGTSGPSNQAGATTSGGSGGGSGSSPAFVQGAIGLGYNANSDAAIFSSNVTNGDMIAVMVSAQGGTIAGVSSSCSGSFAQVDAVSNAVLGATSSDWYALANATGPCTVTASFSGSPGHSAVLATEISGVAATNPLDAHSAMNQDQPTPATDAITSGTATTTQNGDYIWGASVSPNASFSAVSQGTGFTLKQGPQSGEAVGEYEIQSGAGPVSATFTDTADQYLHIQTFMMAFTPASQ